MGMLTLRIDVANPSLDELLAIHDCRNWGYLTACNPGSRRRSDEDNQRCQQALEAQLDAAGFVFFRGAGVPDPDHDPDWTPEASVLVLGIVTEDAARLARQHGQLAFVAGRLGEPPALFVVDGTKFVRLSDTPR